MTDLNVEEGYLRQQAYAKQRKRLIGIQGKREAKADYREEQAIQHPIKTIFSPVKVRRLPTPTQPSQIISKEQNLLQQLFRGERTFGTGQNLPEINGALTSGNGLINSGDTGETGLMFGVRRKLL